MLARARCGWLDGRTRRYGGRVVERTDRAPVATFFAADTLTVGGTVRLSEEAAHHIRVARVGIGDCVALRDGAGRAALGTLVQGLKELRTRRHH